MTNQEIEKYYKDLFDKINEIEKEYKEAMEVVKKSENIKEDVLIQAGNEYQDVTIESMAKNENISPDILMQMNNLDEEELSFGRSR